MVKKSLLLITMSVLCAQVVFGQLSRDLTAFRELDVTDKIVVKLVPGTEDKILIEGELGNQMELTQQDDVLRLKMSSGYLMQGNKVNVTLYSSKVSSIVARKGASVSTESAELNLDSIYVSALEGAKMQLRLHVGKLQAWSTAGSSISAEGEAKVQNVNVAFGGFYLAKNLLSDNATVRTNAGGKVEVNAGLLADAQTRAGGVIDIYGNPKERKHRRLAGGKINFL